MESATSPPTGLARQVRSGFDPVLILLSPPRSGSTALARAFWRHPAFGGYVHEPFDRAYHHSGGPATVLAAVADPLDVGGGAGLILKEMTFQAGPSAAELAAATDLPVVLTVRDPRLAIESRMRQRARAGQRAAFPPEESGWRDLLSILRRFRAERIEYALVDTTRLRARPADVLGALCARLGLPYVPEMLDWPSADTVNLGQLADEQAHWYERVLRASGFQPPTEQVPDIADFPPALRTHAADCLVEYRSLLTDPEMVP